MLQFIPLHTTDQSYEFVENLWHESFPESERREDEPQRDNVDHNDAFTCYLIAEDTLQIGFITVWTLEGFSYVEHLATSPLVRNKGYGRKIMEELRNQFPKLLLLEVEKPVDEMSRRRIGFYQRCGFRLCEKDYVQPPYRKGGESLPMFLMYAGTDDITEGFASIRDEIYEKVYGITSV
ncbi:GNAT family N-acetyltransferase [uncultured Bacteroides sp.]|uniref:GNAT family N-acetyltransferase n=1 Tax=uncultured Bacteroides sp. TaxID=162156 RepID=UPI002590A98A|nr:GNAT family N-acetyltransferase [uncultured Bacteroides sp.]